MFRKRVAGYFKQCNDNFKTEKPLKDHLKMFPDESIRPKVHATTGKLDLGMGEIRKQQKSDKQTNLEMKIGELTFLDIETKSDSS